MGQVVGPGLAGMALSRLWFTRRGYFLVMLFYRLLPMAFLGHVSSRVVPRSASGFDFGRRHSCGFWLVGFWSGLVLFMLLFEEDVGGCFCACVCVRERGRWICGGRAGMKRIPDEMVLSGARFVCVCVECGCVSAQVETIF